MSSGKCCRHLGYSHTLVITGPPVYRAQEDGLQGRYVSSVSISWSSPCLMNGWRIKWRLVIDLIRSTLLIVIRGNLCDSGLTICSSVSGHLAGGLVNQAGSESWLSLIYLNNVFCNRIYNISFHKWEILSKQIR